MKRLLLLLLSGLLLVPVPASVRAGEPATVPVPIDCPRSAGSGTRCLSGRDANGAWYVIAMPANWNRNLVVHAHGGPRTGRPEAADPLEDLDRFAVVVREGYAWVGSTYRRGGYGVRMAAEDTDTARRLFGEQFGRPQRTILHGQSWGGNVAAKLAELQPLAADGSRNYDGVVLTNGVIGGGTRSYQFRADLRAIYQFYCNNHPRPTETAYPLWQGLPSDHPRMSRAELTRRVDECTGIDTARSRRTQTQRRNLRNILAVSGVDEGSLVAHLAWATNLFQDLVQRRLGGHNPFSNIDAVYSGSDDDTALNAGVARWAAEPAAVAALAGDSDLSGEIVLPTLTLHAIHDPTAFVTLEALYRDTVAAAGRSDLLLQTFTDEADHSALSATEYAAVFASLLEWVETGTRPTPAGVAARCETLTSTYRGGCHFEPGFIPTPPLR
jgi:hypothetical protein